MSSGPDHEVDLPEEDTNALIAAAAAAAAVAVEAVDVHAAVLAVEEAAHKISGEGDHPGPLDVDAGPEAKKVKSEHSSRCSTKSASHEDLLAARRLKDRNRYANMTPEQRAAYNKKRREQYHRQNDSQRHKRRERERNRYHSLDDDSARSRNVRRAKLERERYNRMSTQELEERNRLRRERAAAKRTEREGLKNRPMKEEDDGMPALSDVVGEVDDAPNYADLVADV